MHRQANAEALNSLESWFNKRLKTEQFDKFLSRIEFIPPRAMRDIVDRIIDNTQPSPAKFPTVSKIIEQWRIWRHENPQMIADHERTACRDCGGPAIFQRYRADGKNPDPPQYGSGFIWYVKYDDDLNRYYAYVARCGSCENWKRIMSPDSPVPRMTRQQILDRGYRLSFRQRA